MAAGPDTCASRPSRTAEGLVLTEEGRGIVPLAEQMEDGALAMERRLAGQAQTLSGTLRISSADWFGAYVLPPVIAEYSRTYPNVDVEILTGTRLMTRRSGLGHPRPSRTESSGRNAFL
jgi:DNA-binding transcriptional LysR family regulator